MEAADAALEVRRSLTCRLCSVAACLSFSACAAWLQTDKFQQGRHRLWLAKTHLMQGARPNSTGVQVVSNSVPDDG